MGTSYAASPWSKFARASGASPDQAVSRAKKLRVAVVFGGRSAEHEISILSARFVVESLDRDRFEPVLVGIDKHGRWLAQEESLLLGQARDPRLVRLSQAAPAVQLSPYPASGEKSGIDEASDGALATTSTATLDVAGRGPLGVDVVFPVLHGPMGEDGTVQGLLTLADVPFVGSGVLGSAVGMDKDVMKRLLRDAGLPIVPFLSVSAARWKRAREAVLGEIADLGPQKTMFVKPANLGSSVGVSKATGRQEIEQAIEVAFGFDDKVVVEPGVVGLRELECAVLGGDEPIASRVGEIRVTHPDGFYSYAAKYVDEHGATTLVPAEISAEEEERVQRLSLATFEALSCHGLARVDFFRAADGTIYVNEVNTMPGFTAISMYPKLFEASGIGAKALVSRLVDLALERGERRKKLKTSY
ncbi:MAG: D-alanine--D-alanine ligase [Polyangiaceae bacterium]|nr:D-alanine--D-alanine ligase [Polyangiaceae bacterium]